MARSQSVDWRAVSGNLLGGLTLFLYSMEKLSKGIQAACGDELKSLLRTLSFNRYVGFLTGIGVCAVTNSLSCVAVLSKTIMVHAVQSCAGHLIIDRLRYVCEFQLVAKSS